jgi:hypothetical protein
MLEQLLSLCGAMPTSSSLRRRIQSKFAQCFAAGERLMREGLQEMTRLKYNSPEWQAANAKGDAETDKCLEENRACQAKCANP